MKLILILLTIILVPQLFIAKEVGRKIDYDYEVKSLTLNGTKVTIPRYDVSVGEQENINDSEIYIGFTVISSTWAIFRKVENGSESYWKPRVGPIRCCGYGMIAYGNDENFEEDEGHFGFLLKNLKRIDWDKEKGKMTIESKENEMQKPQVIVELKQLGDPRENFE